jgi:hypothetical protein
MSDEEDTDSIKRRKVLPSRYKADGKDARWNRLWLHRSGGNDEIHDDDDGVDRYQSVEIGLPPLPDNMREEGKRSNKGRGPDNDQLQQLHDDDDRP